MNLWTACGLYYITNIYIFLIELILRLTGRAGEKQTASALVQQWFGAEKKIK